MAPTHKFTQEPGKYDGSFYGVAPKKERRGDAEDRESFELTAEASRQGEAQDSRGSGAVPPALDSACSGRQKSYFRLHRNDPRLQDDWPRAQASPQGCSFTVH